MSKWIEPVPQECDLCQLEITAQGSSFVDGSTVFGSWAIMCEVCHGIFGIGLGVGLGQRYDIITRDKLGG